MSKLEGQPTFEILDEPERNFAWKNWFLNLYNKVTALDNISTTTDLEDITNTINTGTDKVLGKAILNETTGVTVFASGDTDGAVWHYYDGTTAHTPA